MVALRLTPSRRFGLWLAGLLAAVLLFQGGRTVGRAQTAPVILVAGWNNFAYIGPAQPVTAALASLDWQYDALWQYDAIAKNWRSFNPRAPETSDFTDVAQGAAYWIHMLKSSVLPIGRLGTVSDQSPALPVGWNNVGHSGPTAPVGEALNPYNVTFSSVWHWNAALQRWELFDPTAPAANEFATLVQGQAYWVQVVAAPPTAAPLASANCYPFESYQPQLSEVAAALERAGTNTLSDDPSFRIPDLHVAQDGGPQTMTGYIPPTLLKSISWNESGWRQATYSVSRGNSGRTITSKSCAYGVSQVLTGMNISGNPTARQTLIGTNYLYNIAAGTQILIEKWNMAPKGLPIYGRRDPRIIEDWYFATWAYHCFGDVCPRYGVHNNPDDPSLKWPRPLYNSPDYDGSRGSFTATDYPYQELIFDEIAYPPTQGGRLLWQAIPVSLPPHGTIGFPVPQSTIEFSAHMEGGQVLAVPTPLPTVAPPPAPAAPAMPTATVAPAATAIPEATTTPVSADRRHGDYFPPVGP